MKTLFALLIAATLATPFAHAASTTALQLKVTEPMPESVPFPVRRSDESEAGIAITFLVTGNRLSEFKPGSLKIDSLAGLSPADAAAGKPALDDAFCHISPTGGTGRFRIRIPAAQPAAALHGLKVKGSVIVFGEPNATTLRPAIIPAAGKAPVRIGDYTLQPLEKDGDKATVHIKGNPARLRDVTFIEYGRTIRPLEIKWTLDGVTAVLRPRLNSVISASLLVRDGDRPEWTVPFTFGE